MPAGQHMDNPNARRILVVCDEGNNRSVTVAGQLKYWGHDCLCVGLNRNSAATVKSLIMWAELVILTEAPQLARIAASTQLDFDESLLGYAGTQYEVWDIGPDRYPRPYNKELLKKVKAIIQQHPELKPA